MIAVDMRWFVGARGVDVDIGRENTATGAYGGD